MRSAAPNDAELRDRLRLARTENIGPVTFRQLVRRFGNAGDALEALPELARRGGARRAFTPPSPRAVEDEIAALEKMGGRFISLGDPAYPEALAAIEDAPPVFAVLGKHELLSEHCIGIVGARNASLNGRKMAERLAHELGAEGFVIVSGFARGIDTAAHKTALATGTAAAMAGGVDVIYPEENRALHDEMRRRGALVSDQPLGAEPRGRLFPRRNRIISGLSLGVIVVEAARKSGSLITARRALDQGREVFAVPGSPLDPRAQGANSLLKQGAVLVESAADVLEHIHALPRRRLEPVLGFEEPFIAPFNEGEAEAAREKILDHLSPSPTPVDDVIRQCGLPSAMVSAVLLELELAGRLERQPGHKVALTN